jgi:uncharacterized protein (TIGR03437 family)
MRAALLYGAFACTAQLNFMIPSGSAKGAATVTVTGPLGSQAAQIAVTDLAPAVFTANRDGHGVPTGQFVLVHADGPHMVQNLATLCGSTYVATAIKVRAAKGQVVLQLYGTGIRHAIRVTATIGGVPVAVLYAAQNYPGLDQVNLQLPKPLQTSGAFNLVITAGDNRPTRSRCSCNKRGWIQASRGAVP